MKIGAVDNAVSFKRSGKKNDEGKVHFALIEDKKKVDPKKIAVALAALSSAAVAGIMIYKGKKVASISNKGQDAVNDIGNKVNDVIQEAKVDVENIVLKNGKKLTKESKDGKMVKAILTDANDNLIHVKEYKISTEGLKTTTVKNAKGVVVQEVESNAAARTVKIKKHDPETGNLIQKDKIKINLDKTKEPEIVFDTKRADIKVIKYNPESEGKEVIEVVDKHIDKLEPVSNSVCVNVFDKETNKITANKVYGDNINQKVIYDTVNENVDSLSENWLNAQGILQEKNITKQPLLNKAYGKQLFNTMLDFNV